MNDDIKVILENAKNQIEAKRTSTYNSAKQAMLAQLQPELDKFISGEKAKYEETVSILTKQYQASIDEKKHENEVKAGIYAENQIAKLNEKIEKLQDMIVEYKNAEA